MMRVYKNFSKVYDVMMEYADYDGWKDIIEEKIERYGDSPKTIVDLGCGTGEVLLRLISDYEMTGVDLSKEMVEIANRKVETASFYVQDMRELKLDKKHDVVISLFDTVNHLISLDGLKKTFSSVWENLNEDGLYIFDVVTRELMEEMFPGGNFIDDRGDIMIIWEHEEDQEEGVDYVDTTFFVKQKNGMFKKITEEYVKKIFTVDEIINTAKEVGFQVVEVEENSELAGERIFFTLKK
ncbi:class I SAM-dependent methyltransferase [Psychrilyobacter sp.]|uniref:class I SAM-dependent DNA methyltransferase n=1 Tax=Psychrilyobacter sp. TaxID=2586924 RepID=UPI00301A2878